MVTQRGLARPQLHFTTEPRMPFLRTLPIILPPWHWPPPSRIMAPASFRSWHVLVCALLSARNAWLFRIAQSVLLLAAIQCSFTAYNFVRTQGPPWMLPAIILGTLAILIRLATAWRNFRKTTSIPLPALGMAFTP